MGGFGVFINGGIAVAFAVTNFAAGRECPAARLIGAFLNAAFTLTGNCNFIASAAAFAIGKLAGISRQGDNSGVSKLRNK